MDMKKLVYYVIAATTVVMATSCNGGGASMREQLDSLQTAYDQRNADYNELNEFLGVIAVSLDSIAVQEGQILGPTESPALNREQIKKNLDAYKQTLDNQRQRLAELEQKVKSSNANSAQMKVIIASLKQQLKQKDEEIAMLRKQVEDQSVDINSLKANVKTLQERSEMQAGMIVSQQEKILEQDAIIRTAYIKMGTKDELKRMGLLTGGLLKKTKVDFTKIDKSLFKAIDIRETKKIDIPAKKAKVMTPQPEDSYRIDKVYNNNVLTITNTEKFWGVSDFVIIMIDD